MFFNFLNVRSSSRARRSTGKSPFGPSIDRCENRTLLSATALHGPTAAQVSSAVDPVGNFAGHFAISSKQGSGDADITQTGNAIKIHLTFNFEGFDATATVTGNHAKGKIKSTFLGQPIRGKFTADLTDPNTVEGSAKIRKSIEGKLTLDFVGTRSA